MSTTFIGKTSFFKIKQKYSKSDRQVSVAKGLLHISPDALAAIGLKVGDKYAVTRADERGRIILKATKSPKATLVQEPETIRFQPTHVLEFLGNNAGISAQEMPLTDITFEVRGPTLFAQLPDIVKTSYLQDRKRRVADAYVDWRDVIRGHRGASAALALDAHRNALKGEIARSVPINQQHLIWLLREEGHRVHQLNERLWRLDDRTATLGDLIQLARRYEEGLVLVAA